MNGLATALDTAADRCFQTIKRSVAAPSPEYWRTTSFYQKRICEKYLTVPEPEAAQPQDLAVIGHGDDLLYWIHALACTHILPHNLRLFNLRDGGVQFAATALFNLKRRRCSTGALYSVKPRGLGQSPNSFVSFILQLLTRAVPAWTFRRQSICRMRCERCGQ